MDLKSLAVSWIPTPIGCCNVRCSHITPLRRWMLRGWSEQESADQILWIVPPDWYVTPCSLVEVYRCFWRANCSYIRVYSNQAACLSNLHRDFPIRTSLHTAHHTARFHIPNDSTVRNHRCGYLEFSRCRKLSYPHNRPWGPLGLWDVMDPTLFR
jgi:hypothetical protein